LDSDKIERKRHKVQKDIYVIEINLAASIHYWIIDTKSCAHIYTNMQALVHIKHLKKGEVTLKVANGVSISAMTISSISLYLDSDLIINLNMFIIFRPYLKILYLYHVWIRMDFSMQMLMSVIAYICLK
jgi:hypothetical protein